MAYMDTDVIAAILLCQMGSALYCKDWKKEERR